MDQERPIEKLLRACAKARREAAAKLPGLHPATRRLLQGEVARELSARQPAASPARRWRFGLWPGLAWGLAMLGVLGVATVLLFPNLGKRQPAGTFLARNDLPARRAPAEAPRPATPATPPPVPALGNRPSHDKDLAAARADRQQLPQERSASTFASPGAAVTESEQAPQDALAANAPLSLAKKAKQPAAPVYTARAPDSGNQSPAPPVAADSSIGARGGAAPAAAENLDRPAVAAPAPAAAPQAILADGTSPAGTLHKELQPAVTTQRFYRLSLEDKGALAQSSQTAPSSPILQSFRLEQTGQTLRIIDGDGSVYTGAVEVASAPARQRAELVGDTSTAARRSVGAAPLAVPRGAPAPAALSPAVAGYSFRVTGTNRVLNQKVVFTGTFLPATNAAAPAQPTGKLGVGGSLDEAAPPGTPPPNWGITGKAVINGRQELPINAQPVPPGR
jgi:hypothetical protein